MKSASTIVFTALMLVILSVVLEHVNEVLCYWWGVQTHPDWVIPIFAANVAQRVNTDGFLIGCIFSTTAITVAFVCSARQKILLDEKISRHVRLLFPVHNILHALAAVILVISGTQVARSVLSISALVLALAGQLDAAEQLFHFARSDSQVAVAATLGTQSGRVIDGTAAQQSVESWKVTVNKIYGPQSAEYGMALLASGEYYAIKQMKTAASANLKEAIPNLLKNEKWVSLEEAESELRVLDPSTTVLAYSGETGRLFRNKMGSSSKIFYGVVGNN